MTTSPFLYAHPSTVPSPPVSPTPPPPPPPPPACTGQTLDKDDNGEIDEEEFLRWVTENGFKEEFLS